MEPEPPKIFTRRDDLQLHSLPGDDSDIAKADEEHEASQPGQRAAQGEGGQHDAARWQASHARGIGIGADRIQPPAERQKDQHQLKQDDDGNRQRNHQAHVNIADREQIDALKIDQPARQVGGCHRARA